MNDSSEDDAELAELRARRLQEILARRGPAESQVSTDSMPRALTSASFPGFLSVHPRAVVDVWAPWCGPCRAMAPVLDALAKELAGKVSFGKLNADEEPALAGRWNVEGVPTLLLFEKGRLVDRIVGSFPHDALSDRLRATFRLSQLAPSDATE
ncbi:MAG TPA: thioredoxin family protein [Thermoplasmata archaeon]|nr:thioredoxin family protein [Thermoplasmata archaeon]